ncbi:hypothetical protein NITHO_1430005 [Nitrolancea hollandica Lb]|uniref:Uncharacterized protein n=1 Tax=Nitrolancea hollandica Lb TaxID=1129897 RepID=I4EDB3_9BACT|nr:hypothetical protein NITHO_1430005 [Nitrolancea hollandica Lb]
MHARLEKGPSLLEAGDPTPGKDDTQERKVGQIKRGGRGGRRLKPAVPGHERASRRRG